MTKLAQSFYCGFLSFALAAGLTSPVAVATPSVSATRATGGTAPESARCVPASDAAEQVLTTREAPADRPLRGVAEPENPTFSAPGTPQRMIPGDEYQVRVSLRNTTDSLWLKEQLVLSYRWELPDGSDQTGRGSRLETALPADLAPGSSVELDARVRSPQHADVGNRRESFVLRWDMWDRERRSWLSETAGLSTLDQAVTVEDPTSNQLGLEQFYQYSETATGAGSILRVNQFSGNAVVSYDPVSNPSRGPATFIRITYNSQDTAGSPVGRGWSVAASTLTRLGSPLEFHGGLLGPPRRVTFVDGDGTSHVFERNKDGGYDSPAGVHLHLRLDREAEPDRRWVLTRPERTRFFFDEDGFHTATADNNGNELTLGYERAFIGGRHTKVLKHVTDATGRRTLTLDYYQRGDHYTHFAANTKQAATDLANTAILHQLKSITDVSGRTIVFTYGEDGLLQEIVDAAGTPEAKPFTFFYDDGHRARNPKLTSVVDPNGNDSGLAYFTDPADNSRQWHVRSVTDRRGGATGFDYTDPDGRDGSKIESTVTDANGHATRFLIDGFGRPERLVNAKGEVSELGWDADNNVIRMREANGATTTWVYDQKTGFPLEIRDAVANAEGHPPTRLTYRTALDGHVADLTERITPEGRRWLFVYDDNGNLVSNTDPKGTATPDPGDFTARYAYDELGHLITTTNANGHTTTYADYDPNGYPRRITDPRGCSSFFQYDAVGNVTSTMDARGTRRTFTYDIVKRPLSTVIPKDHAAGELIVTPGPRYDRNDNVLEITSANGAVTTSVYDEADQQVAVSAPRDNPGDPAKITTFAYDPVGNLVRSTQPKGTLTADPGDFTTTYTYDEINQLLVTTDALGQRTSLVYNDVGDVVTEIDARKNASPDPDDYTTKYAYDLNHRVVEVTDAAGHSLTTRYDRDGNMVETTDEDGNTTVAVLDERAMPVEVRAPHREADGEITYFTTRFEYDQVGNRTRAITPRGVATADDPDDFVRAMVYDELDRLVEEVLPFDPDDERVSTPDRIFYAYDEVGNLSEVSAPPSEGQSVRNVTRYTYFDNGWMRSSTDAWGITTNYDYNPIGQQTNRTFISAGGGSSRTMTWDYYPDGKLRSRSDDGVPVGKHVVLVDNSDANDVEVVGDWETVRSKGDDHQGYDYRIHGPGTGTDSFTWKAFIPADGRYEVFVRYAAGTATDAKYTVAHDDGMETVTVDQTQQVGEWVSLGTFSFTEGDTREVTLSDEATGTVVADAVRLVRDNSGDVDTERKTFGRTYDANDNLARLTDASEGARVDEYLLTHDMLDRVTQVEERDDGAVRNTTGYAYDPVGNLTEWRHDDQIATYEYDIRDLVSRASNRGSTSDTEARVTTFTYTARSHLQRQVKHNGNTVDFEYYLDGKIRHQVERKSSGEVVNEHTLEYNPNGHLTRDQVRKQNADDHAEIRDDVVTYTYDPRDRIRRVVRADADGNERSTETYVHDANNNVVEQTVDGTTTSYRYDRNRLVSATANDVTSIYGYDPFGRLHRVSSAGQQLERYVYDGFDRTAEHRAGSGDQATITRYGYDPLDRTRTRTRDATGSEPETTELFYLGLSEQVLTERVDGQVRKTYQHSPHGELLSQVTFPEDGEREAVYYSFNPHSDVDSVTDENGDNKATYGYTAYGQDDQSQFTGVDKPGPQNPDAEPYNAYRFNTKRFDAATGSYDMGFRDYRPAENRFLSLDLFNGALADLGLSVNPFTMGRYSFGGGNPISAVELDGHWPSLSDIGHAALDVAGLVPVVGEVADVANGIWYAAEGNYVDAALSFGSAIPFAGYAATAIKAGKYASKGIEAAQGVDNAVDAARTTNKLNGASNPARGTETGGGKPRTGDGKPADTRPPTQPKPEQPAKPSKPDQPAAPSCPRAVPNSFAADTPVLMADGNHEDIEDVRPGDQVLATDPVSGRTEARTVTAAITGQGLKNLVEITVDSDGASGSADGTVVATDGHPFWVGVERAWVDAENLAPGDWLRAPDGTMRLITAVRTWTSYLRVHNLTVDGLHTYHVTAGGADLLVHNQGCGNLQPGNNPNAQLGQRVHQDPAVEKAFEAIGYTRGQRLATGRTPDFVTPGGHPVELKPFSRTGIRKGTRQLRQYMRDMGATYGELWVYAESNGLLTLQKYAVPAGPRRWNRLLGWPR